MAEDKGNNQSERSENAAPETGERRDPPVAGFLTANPDLHVEERNKMDEVNRRAAKKQQEVFQKPQEEGDEEEEARDNDASIEDDNNPGEPISTVAESNDNNDTAQPLNVEPEKTLVDEEETAEADEPATEDDAPAEEPTAEESAAEEAPVAEPEELEFEDDMSEEDRENYLKGQEAARKAAEEEAKAQDEATEGQIMTVSQAIRNLYDIPYTTPAFEQRAQEHHYRLMGINFDPDQEERPLNIGINLTETFAEVSVARALTPSGITAQTAYELAQIASLNPAIKEHGVVIVGTEEDQRLLYHAAKAFNLKIANEQELPNNIDEVPAAWTEFMNTVPTPTLDLGEDTAAEEATEEAAPEQSGYENEVSETPAEEVAAEPETQETETAVAAEPEVQEKAEAEEPAETVEEADTAEAEEVAEKPETPETPETDELLGETDDEHNEYLQQVRELTREFNRVGVTSDLYQNARNFVEETGMVSRKRLRDKFTIGATKASAILKGLELEGVVEKTGANGRRVIPQNERKQTFS
jgi:ribosomal protein S25